MFGIIGIALTFCITGTVTVVAEAARPPKSLLRKKSPLDSFLKWLALWSHPQFCLVAVMNASISVICMFEGFDSFVTLFLAGAFGVDPATAASTAVALPSGLIASLVFGGAVLEGYSRKAKARSFIAGLLSTTMSFCVMLVITAQQTKATTAEVPSNVLGVAFLLFGVGFGAGCKFYLTSCN
jgi:hypothetical protein